MERTDLTTKIEPVVSNDLNEKINLLSENVQSLLDRDQTIDEEIKTVKSDFEAMAKGMSNQIQQINENLNGTFTYASSCDEYFQQGNRFNGTYFIRPNQELHAFQVECEFTDTEGRTVLKPEDWTKMGYIFPKNERERC